MKKILYLLTIFVFISCDAKYAEVFVEKGIKTNANITKLINRRQKKSTTGSRMNLYAIEVNYFVKSNEEKTGEKPKTDYGFESLNKLAENFEIGEFTRSEISVSSQQFFQLQEGQQVEIYYLSDEPAKAILAEDVDKFREAEK
ncbi:MAG: hypothetical protein JXB49_03280 [Bacteroidales bacterium]|nr:hypothetical protein [Bacteroidales bacterium]